MLAHQVVNERVIPCGNYCPTFGVGLVKLNYLLEDSRSLRIISHLIQTINKHDEISRRQVCRIKGCGFVGCQGLGSISRKHSKALVRFGYIDRGKIHWNANRPSRL